MWMWLEEEKLWPEMASKSVVLQLDVLFFSLTALTWYHATLKRGYWKGTALILFLAFHTAAFEHLSLFLGGTHCHATSPIFPMISPCSTINSVLFYVPWTYTSIEAALRLQLSPLIFPLVVGLLQFGFGATYEMQGPINNFWKWPDEYGIIANSRHVLQPWDGYPHLQLLDSLKNDHSVAVVGDGIFYVSDHARVALGQRSDYGFPILAPYFHFAFGFGWGLGLALTGPISYNNKQTNPVSLWRLITAGFSCTGTFILPVEITRSFSDALGLPYSKGVLISLFFAFILSFLSKISMAKKNQKKSITTEFPNDLLLFLISAFMHAFMFTIFFRAAFSTPMGLFALVTTVSTIYLPVQYYCCFLATVKAKEKMG